MDAARADTLLRAECTRLGHAFWGTKDYDLLLFGIRAAGTASDTFDDAIGCRYFEGGVLRVEVWKATTDPGRPGLLTPSRPQGCAVLPDGQYRGLWEVGLHKGKYEALLQRTPVAVWRDNNLDAFLDFDSAPLDPPALIGLNCHRAGADSPIVGAWSQGCQVHKRSATFDRMMQLVRNQKAAGRGTTYSYTLFSVRRSPGLAELLAAAT